MYERGGVEGRGVEMRMAEGMPPGSHAGQQRWIQLPPTALPTPAGPAHPPAYPDCALTPTLLAASSLPLATSPYHFPLRTPYPAPGDDERAVSSTGCWR